MVHEEHTQVQRFTPPPPEEARFIGLVREATMEHYVGRGSQLTDDELRAIFALARAVLRDEKAGGRVAAGANSPRQPVHDDDKGSQPTGRRADGTRLPGTTRLG